MLSHQIPALLFAFMNAITSTSALYTDLGCLNIHPGPNWTRFVCISDTHSREYPIPEGDVLIHAGDLTRHGSSDEVYSAISWLASLPHHVKL